MKRLMISMLSLVLTMPALAQYGRPVYNSRPSRPAYQHRSYTDVYYGLRLGMGLSTVSSDDRYLDGGKIRTGLNVGAVMGFQLGPNSPVYLETGLSYAEKGGEGKFEGAKFTYNLDYLEIPLVVKYDYNVDGSLSIQPYLGGYFSVGVGGKIKDFGMRQAYSSFDDEGFKRTDAGLKLGCGFQYDHLYAEIGYDVGLANISHDYFDTSHTGSLFLNIGVNF